MLMGMTPVVTGKPESAEQKTRLVDSTRRNSRIDLVQTEVRLEEARVTCTCRVQRRMGPDRIMGIQVSTAAKLSVCTSCQKGNTI
jgi:hypothetical protein